MTDRDLFANFDRMRREMDELLGGVLQRTPLGRRRLGFSPPVDVAYTAQPAAAVVTVDLAGVDVGELDLEIDGRRVILAGVRGPAAADEGAVYQQVEIERGSFRRVVMLAVDVNAEEAAATYENGMLRIEIPVRVTAAQTRTVPVEGGER